MVVSATVSSGDTILATQYNNVRADAVNVSTGHKHTGASESGPILFVYDTFANRPAASQIGRLFYASDTKALYRDNGATWDLISAGMNKVGEDNSEKTTTSLVEVSLSAVASLSIPTTSALFILHAWRKTAGAANAANFGLRLNATTIKSPSSDMCSATNQAENGIIVYWIAPQVANYLRAGAVIYSNGVTQSLKGVLSITADFPNATITDVIVRAQVDNASVTAASDELRVFELP